MCGICGIVSLSGVALVDAENRIGRMIRLLHHRGPDAAGFHISANGRVALGNTRLAIVDPSTDLHIPMSDAAGRTVLTFNGEIYNYRELRAALDGQGVAWKSKSDTEVLVEGLAREGEAFLTRLDGMWGLGYLENSTGAVVLSRDLMGERHVFFATTANELIFASEPAPVLALLNRRAEFSPESIAASIMFRTSPRGATLVEGLQRLKSGEILRVEANGAITRKRLLRLRPERWFEFFDRDPDEKSVLDAYEEAISAACDSRVPTEVDFYATLSGGIDSNLVVAYASRLGARRIRTLHGQSHLTPPKRGETDLDEVAAAESTSRLFGTDHHFFRMFDQDIASVLRQTACNAFDGVIDEGSASFQLLAEQVRAKGAKVMLISDGPDEMCGGYKTDRHQIDLTMLRETNPAMFALFRLGNLGRIPRAVTRRLFGDHANIPDGLFGREFRYEPVHQSFTADFARRILMPDVVCNVETSYGMLDADYEGVASKFDLSQKMALCYAASSLPDQFNLRTDKAIMRPSVECRLPLQAPTLAELMIATPMKWRYGLVPENDFNLDFGTTKYILRRLVQRRIGRQISHRNKYGFSAPLWRHPGMAETLKIEEIIRQSPLFDAAPFRPGAKAFMLRPEQRKLRWFAYSLAMTWERMRTGDYGEGAPGSRAT